VLADISLEAWLESIEPSDDSAGSAPGAKRVGYQLDSDRPKLLDHLRERTTRRG
jgi:hypothetical protein